MRAAVCAMVLAVGLAGCSQNDSAPQPEVSASTESTVPSPTPTTPTPVAPSPTRTATPTTPAPEQNPTKAGAQAFCDYLEKTSGQQQQVEDPAQFVALVEGAVAVAPGSIAEDAQLYAESVRRLADTVSGGPKKAAKAEAWLTANEAAVAQAEANLNSYTESTCGRPFITGEGG